MTFRPDVEYAHELDAGDELAGFRDRFVIDDPDYIYLDGNSLGRLPRATIERVEEVVRRQWGSRLIRSWNEGWMELPEQVGAKVAQLLGARADEVIIADSTSVNLFKLTLAALQARPGRTKIVTDDLSFPSDVYIFQGILQLMGSAYSLEIVPSDGLHGPVEGLVAAVDEETAVVALTQTLFKSGYNYDLAEVGALAREAGALMLWDASHSVGSVPIDYHGHGVDLAVGCSYKYVNGGPGAPAFLYVRRELQEKLGNPISGWMGQKDPFAFELQYRPSVGLRRFLTGTPSVLSLAAMEPGVDLLLEAGMERLRAKSVSQTEYLIALWEHELRPLGFRLNSPRQAERRGSHITLGHDDGLAIDLALIHEMKVQPDFRAPDNIRFGIAPLYNSYYEIHEAMRRLKQVVVEELYEKYAAGAPAVT